MQRITDDPATAEALIAAGLDSAHRIAMMPAHRFAREHADLFGGDEFAARQAHERAAAVKAAVSHLRVNLHDVLGSAHFAALHGNHADSGLADYFSAIPSYQELFGSLDYRPWPDCGSILGPAAYFTDVMRIIDGYITDANPGIPAGYRLDQRRPDLFELPLSCANTSDLVPMLQIVNVVLARRIASARQVTAGTARGGGPASVILESAASPDDGAYTGMLVMIVSGTGTGQAGAITGYDGAIRVASVAQTWATAPDTSSGYVISPDPYATLASARYPFSLPWNLPLAQTRASLETLRVSLQEIHQSFAAPVTGGTARANATKADAVQAEITLAAEASSADGAYNTMTVALTGGTGAGQVRTITAYAGESGVATVDRPWHTPPDGTTQYHVLDSLSADLEQLGLSAEQYQIVTTPVSTGPDLAPYYGLTTLDPAEMSRAEVFLDRTGLTLATLADLLDQGLSSAERAAGAADGFFINATGEIDATGKPLSALRLGTDATDPNAPVQVIQNLSLRRLRSAEPVHPAGRQHRLAVRGTRLGDGLRPRDADRPGRDQGARRHQQADLADRPDRHRARCLLGPGEDYRQRQRPRPRGLVRPCVQRPRGAGGPGSIHQRHADPLRPGPSAVLGPLGHRRPGRGNQGPADCCAGRRR